MVTAQFPLSDQAALYPSLGAFARLLEPIHYRMEWEDAFLAYLKELEKTFGEDAMPMMLLKTTTMVYPLLNNFGISLHAPIAVIVDKESGRRQVLEHLLGFEKDIANSLSACPKEIRKQIQNSKYGFSVFIFTWWKSAAI